jgi:hypothetical protein
VAAEGPAATRTDFAQLLGILIKENVWVVGHGIFSGHHTEYLLSETQATLGQVFDSPPPVIRKSAMVRVSDCVPLSPHCEVQSHDRRGGWCRMRTKKEPKTSANNTRFRPGTTGACEAQLWTFVSSSPISRDDDVPPMVHWVAAESLDAALRYLRLRHDDFIITEARFLGMIALLSGSPLD